MLITSFTCRAFGVLAAALLTSTHLLAMAIGPAL